MRKRDNYNEYMRTYMINRYRERRELAVNLLGGKCVLCGSTDGLELDHIDPFTKKYNLGRQWNISLNLYLEELEKCQLLCTECHITKSVDDVSRKKRNKS